MGEISENLQKQLSAADITETSPFQLIVTLTKNSDWSEGLRLVQEVGLDVSSYEKEISAIFGSATAGAIHRLIKISDVNLVELDETITAIK